MSTTAAAAPLVAIEGLSIRFGSPGAAPTVDAVDLAIGRGEIVALVGESGSGKSLLAHTIAGILTPAAFVTAKRLVFGGVDLRDRRAAAELRGREIGTVFQNPRSALNPVRSVGRQIADVIREHRGLRGVRLDEAVNGALVAVRIPDPAARAGAYPGELSGGMCQRVMIAMALAGNPSLLIADEPTTGLDTTTQAAILDLIVGHARARRMATLLITHDLGLARAYAERIVVMHAGQVVEAAATPALFGAPRHPYAAALIAATPARAATVDDLAGIPGGLPDRETAPPCRFAGRCARVVARCRAERPPLLDLGGGHDVACFVPL
ncbi:MAG TPA: ABC transporter ATP-binding protein [Bauldia sp.]|nr:ABC transporter ATP-binding protein [Bauldia sp.]